MKKILITSDKYSFCLDGYQKLFNRHWKEEDLEFTVLGFAQPNATLQDNFIFQSFGSQYNDASPWVNALGEYFTNLKDDYFFLCFEDHYLIGDVDVKLLNHGASIMENDKSIGKVRLLPRYSYNVIASEYDENFNAYDAKENVVSATSLRPSIWRKSYFMRLLNNPTKIMNPSEFEDKNQAVFLGDTTMLMAKGVAPIYPDIDAFRHGGLNRPPLEGPGEIDMHEYKLFIDQADVNVFIENALRHFDIERNNGKV